jgi:hypothetical protein
MANGVRITKIYETSDTSKMPTTSAVVWSEGINLAGGVAEFLTLRYNMTFGATPVAGSDISSLINSIRIVANGTVVHDFSSGFSSQANTTASQYGYLLNKIGGRVVELCDDSDPATRVGQIMIPLGVVLEQGTSRLEVIVNWSESGTGATITSGSMSYYVRYNPNTQKGTYVTPATSFTSNDDIAQVIVRVPASLPAGATVDALAIFNDSASDELGNLGVRINAISDFGLPADFYRAQNGDAVNGIQFNSGSQLTGSQLAFTQKVEGSLLVPTFGLTTQDISLTLDDNSGSSTTRKFLPIITYPISQKVTDTSRQTQAVVGNTASAILSNDLQ